MTRSKLKNHFLSLFFICSSAFLLSAQTPCNSGMAGTYPCSNVDLMSHINPATLGNPTGGGGNDIWGWTHPVTGREYALVGLKNGTAFVDITAPTAPVNIGFLPTHVAGNNSWRDIKVANGHAYIGSEKSGHGIQIFELDRLDVLPNSPITFTEDGWIGLGRSHNIVANEEKNLIYAVGTQNTCSGGISTYDVSNPTSPTFLNCNSADGYSHDSQCFVYRGPDTDHTGKELCFSYSGNTVTILDMNATGNPIIKKISYTGEQYTHQGWITDDQRYILVNDELDENNNNVNTTTYIFDVSDLDNPVAMTPFVNSTAAIDHNLYIKGPYLYQANYRAGMRILDISDLANAPPTEVAYFDVYPGNNNAGFQGSWSVYPYFDSDHVIINGIGSTGGLFVVKPNLPHNVLEVSGTGVDTICPGDEATFLVDNKAFSGMTTSDNLTVTGLPSGTTASFSANPVPVNSAVTITISGTSGLANGNYSFTVTGTEVPVNRMSLSFTVAGAAPSASSLVSPANNSILSDINILFNWTASLTTDYYELQVAEDPLFTTIIYTATGLTTNSHTLSVTEVGIPLYWRVVSYNSTCGIGVNSNRWAFSLNDNPTPVELVKFQARAKEDLIELNWQTASELDNTGFELERATEADHLQFEKIAWIPTLDGQASTLQEYSYPDRDVKTGVLYYYRLKQVDLDGEFSYSPTVSGGLEANATTITAFPNPAQNELSVQLDATSFFKGAAELSVCDMTGKLLIAKSVDMESLANPYTLDISELAKGTYMLQLSNNQLNLPLRFVKL